MPVPSMAVLNACKTASGGGPTTVLEDTFTRADAGTLGTSTSGAVWGTPLNGTFSIVSNTARVGGTNNEKSIIIESTASDFTATIDMTTASTLSNVGFVFRASATNNYLLFTMDTANTVRLYKCATGTFTQLASATVTLATSTTYAVEVICSGDSVTIKVDGATAITHTLSAGDQTTYGSNTKVGLRQSGATGSGVIWDNLLVTT